MKKADVVLSDVHLEIENCSSKFLKNYYETKFIFSSSLSNFENYSSNKHPLSGNGADPQEDQDGDLDPPRKKSKINYISINHRQSSELTCVGNQVWKASLLLSDFILENEEIFKNSKVLELGAGVGLSSVVAAKNARYVICTDFLKESLDLSKKNLESNKHFYESQKKLNFDFSALPLDWCETLEQNYSDVWNEKEKKILTELDIIMAADVIYRNDLTDNLFATLGRLIQINSNNRVNIYIACEKRLNFCIEELEVACPAYNYFLNKMTEMKNSSHFFSSNYFFEMSQIKNIGRRFHYNKNKYLELWKIIASKKKK